jgi:predicted lipoprotein with Yx(FWY)xxD motif
MRPGLQKHRSARLPVSLRALASSRAVLAAVPLAALLLASGCGGSSPTRASSATGTSPPGGPKVTLMARSVTGVGTVLVTSAGYTLYMFAPDHRRAVTCTGLCTSYWPPLKLPSGDAVAAGPGVKSSLLGSDPDPGGGRVVTYNGWPLYTYASDIQPGQATGQGIDLNGGKWYVMRPSGAPLISAP